jgi:hypothetical protein
VGYFTARAQLARRPLLDGWSLSGVAMSAAFATWALSHLTAGMLAAGDPWSCSTNLGVHDWNRRPLVGRAAPLGRRSPWAEQGA